MINYNTTYTANEENLPNEIIKSKSKIEPGKEQTLQTEKLYEPPSLLQTQY